MNLLDIILLAVALAMDCFAVSIVSGITNGRGRWVIRMALLFGFFQALPAHWYGKQYKYHICCLVATHKPEGLAYH